MSFLGPLAPNFDAALRDVTAANERYREMAAAGLANPPEGREEEARTALATLYQDRFGPIRALALEGLIRLGDAEDFDLVAIGLEDEHASVRAVAVGGCATLDPDRDLSWSEVLLGDAHAIVRARVIEVVIGGASSTPELYRGNSTERVSGALFTNALKRIAKDPDVMVRRRCRLLSQVENARRAEVQRVLYEMLADTSGVVRLSAAIAIAEMKSEKASGKSFPENSKEAAALIASHIAEDRQLALDAIDASTLLPTEGVVMALIGRGRRFFTDLVSKAAIGGALLKIDAENDVSWGAGNASVEILRSVLNAMRGDGRDYALRAIAAVQSSNKKELLSDVLQLVKRRRYGGASPSALEEALQSFDSPDAKDALSRLQS